MRATAALATLLALGVVAFATFVATPSSATEADVWWQCSSTSASGSATVGWCPGSAAYPLPVTLSVGTAVTGNATGTTGAVVGTLAAVAGKITYICGFDVSALGGTATVGPVTVAGLLGSSMTYQFSSTAAGATFGRTYSPCVPASATNTAITVTTTADGTASAVDVNSWGYQQ